jgi:hypothetical protein
MVRKTAVVSIAKPDDGSPGIDREQFHSTVNPHAP